MYVDKSAIFLISFLILGSNVIAQHNDFWYVWGVPEGHVSSDIVLYKDSNTYRQIFIDDLWVQEIKGVYEVRNDSIILTCQSGCLFRNSNLGVIVVENTDTTKRTIIKSTDERILDGYSYNLNGDTLEVLKGEKVIHCHQLKNKQTKSFTVVIPFEFSFYHKGETIIGTFSDQEFISFDNYKFLYSAIIEEKKKKCIFGKKNRR